MHHQGLFHILCGKIDDDHPNDIDPQSMATYADIIELVSQVEYQEGIDYYHHKIGQCQQCDEDMDAVRMLTKAQFIPVVRYIIKQAKPQSTAEQKFVIRQIIFNRIFEQIDGSCVNCGVDYDKYGTFGLHEHIIEAFFRHASDIDLWEKDEQVYLQQPKLNKAED